MYRITIERLKNGPENAADVKLYEQTLDVAELNLMTIVAAINRKPRKSRAKQPGAEPAKK